MTNNPKTLREEVAKLRDKMIKASAKHQTAGDKEFGQTLEWSTEFDRAQEKSEFADSLQAILDRTKE